MTKVKDAIRMLQDYLDPEELIVIDWWDKSLFESMHSVIIDDNDWNIIVNKMDDHGREFACEQISNSISELILENQKQVGSNIQINNMIKAMVNSEPCLFNNSEENLMPVTKTTTSIKDLLMDKYEVNAWISTGYTFIVKANSPDEARQKVKDGEVVIDYNKLSVDSYWDIGDVHLDDVYKITQGDTNE